MTPLFLFLNFLSTYLFSWMIPQFLFWFVLGAALCVDIIYVILIFKSVLVSIPDDK